MIVQSDFKPAWWLPHPHLQTLWPVLLRKEVKTLALQHERIELPDSDFLDVVWVGRDQLGPLVLMLHGFEGSIHSHYVKGMLHALQRSGYRGLFIHFRGCSSEPNRLLRGYHSGETQDLELIVNLVRKREPHTPLAAIGYSLGGNVLLKWLSEKGENNPLTAAIAISTPFELTKAAHRMQRGFSRFYQWYLLRCLRKRLKRKFSTPIMQHHATWLDDVKTIIDFDNRYTAPIHGFQNAHHYYLSASSRQYLSHICVPTLLLQAQDDPFMTEEVIPDPQELSSYVQLEVTAKGGHVGFVSGHYPWKPIYWLEERVPQFLSEYL
jgi:predicted alpha/beta-fold hydrolase